MGAPNPINYAKEYEDLDYQNKDCGVECDNHCDECPYKTPEKEAN